MSSIICRQSMNRRTIVFQYKTRNKNIPSWQAAAARSTYRTQSVIHMCRPTGSKKAFYTCLIIIIIIINNLNNNCRLAHLESIVLAGRHTLVDRPRKKLHFPFVDITANQGRPTTEIVTYTIQQFPL